MAEVEVKKLSNLLFDPIKTQSKVTNSVLVGFSGGKDSIATLDLCFKYFKTVRAFFMYLVPDLEFQEKMLSWYENKYNTEIIRLPHFEVSNFLKYGSFTMFDLNVELIGINDIYSYLRKKTGIHWISAGERCADSITRNAMIKNSGSIDRKRGRFYPLAYWKKQDVLQYIKYRKLYLSPEQKQLGFSFRSLAGKEIKVIKERYPKDYEKILKVYPFIGAGVKRYEQYDK